MSRRERAKGARGELEVAAIFREAGFDCDRTPNSGALRIAGDLYGELPCHVEVKRQEVARPWLWAEQARSDAPNGAFWCVALRRSHSPWLALVELAPLVALLARLELATLELGVGPLASLRERAEWLLDHWTEPAFARPAIQEAALELARGVLAATTRPAP